MALWRSWYWHTPSEPFLSVKLVTKSFRGIPSNRLHGARPDRRFYVFGHFLAVTGIPFIAADWITGLPFHRNIIMMLIILVYLIGGSFIDDLAFMILATPIFYPAVLKLGFDPIWFGIMIAITLMIGVIIPPIAISVFVVKNITGEPFSVIYRASFPFSSVFLPAPHFFLSSRKLPCSCQMP